MRDSYEVLLDSVPTLPPPVPTLPPPVPTLPPYGQGVCTEGGGRGPLSMAFPSDSLGTGRLLFVPQRIRPKNEWPRATSFSDAHPFQNSHHGGGRGPLILRATHFPGSQEGGVRKGTQKMSGPPPRQEVLPALELQKCTVL